MYERLIISLDRWHGDLVCFSVRHGVLLLFCSTDFFYTLMLIKYVHTEEKRGQKRRKGKNHPICTGVGLHWNRHILSLARVLDSWTTLFQNFQVLFSDSDNATQIDSTMSPTEYFSMTITLKSQLNRHW